MGDSSFFPHLVALYCLLEIGFSLVAPAGLKLGIFLPQPPEYWDNTSVT